MQGDFSNRQDQSSTVGGIGEHTEQQQAISDVHVDQQYKLAESLSKPSMLGARCRSGGVLSDEMASVVMPGSVDAPAVVAPAPAGVEAHAPLAAVPAGDASASLGPWGMDMSQLISRGESFFEVQGRKFKLLWLVAAA